MKKKINITRTFDFLRKRPPEVSFAQVESWVKNHQIAPVKPDHWLSIWLSRWRSSSE